MLPNFRDGQPAFPTILTEDSTDYFGMTLHEWYAGQALSLLGGGSSPDHTAALAWSIADAMMAEREKRGLT